MRLYAHLLDQAPRLIDGVVDVLDALRGKSRHGRRDELEKGSLRCDPSLDRRAEVFRLRADLERLFTRESRRQIHTCWRWRAAGVDPGDCIAVEDSERGLDGRRSRRHQMPDRAEPADATLHVPGAHRISRPFATFHSRSDVGRVFRPAAEPGLPPSLALASRQLARFLGAEAEEPGLLQSLKLIEFLFQRLEALTRLSQLALGRQALVLGQIARGFRNQPAGVCMERPAVCRMTVGWLSLARRFARSKAARRVRRPASTAPGPSSRRAPSRHVGP